MSDPVPSLSEGAAILSDVSEFIRRFVSLSEIQAYTCALWVVHTHAIEAAEFTPYLDINSAVLQSGKTRLLEVFRLVARNSWFTGRVSGAALVRKIDSEHPTLLLDESDTAFSSGDDYSEKLRGILNTGFERDGTYSVCVQKGNDWESRDFSTFSPKAIAGIGKLPPTIRDRAIPISLKRALRSEQRQRFRKRKVQPEVEQLRKRIELWASGNLDALREAEPQLPDELTDRQQDVGEPLLAIADQAGSEWPERARQALIALLASQVARDDSQGVRLLADIRSCFESHGEKHDDRTRIRSSRLLESLTSNEEWQWAEFHKGFPLKAAALARLLSPFDIRPRDLRFEGGIFKGYEESDFEDAWSRYLPPASSTGSEGQPGQQAAVYAASRDFPEGQHARSVAGSKSEESPVNTRGVADVAPRRGDKGNGAAGLEMPWCSHSQESWWKRPDGGFVCGVCHPNPAA
jgi:hypothetical protein